MSFFDDASLAFLPSSGAGKDGKAYSIKPTTGAGDFTFSRGSNLAATRVGPTGLIEKGRENLVKQSNNFGTTWATIDSNVTSGQSGYDGSSNAWELDATTAGGRLYQSISFSGVHTFSIYAKKGTANGIRVRLQQTAVANAYVDLRDGSLFGYDNAIDVDIQDVSNGWYRITFALNASGVSIILLYPTDGATSQVSGTIFIQDAQLEIGLAATDYIESGATTGKAGLLEDEPRFDYSGGATCPSLLLEPSRTQLVTQTEYKETGDFTNSTPSYNATNSPEGIQNATEMFDNATNGQHRIGISSFAVTSGADYTISAFVKNNDIGYCYLLLEGGFTQTRYYFNLSTGQTITSGLEVENFGNDWYRIYVTQSAASTGTGSVFLNMSNNGASPIYAGSGQSLFYYGFQAEAGSYPTSYIPNHSGGSVTRGADACNDAGDASTFNSTEGVLFAEIAALANDGTNRAISLIKDNNNTISLFYFLTSNTIRALILNGGSTQVQIDFALSDTTDFNKIAFKYKENDVALYVNGVQVGTDTTATIPTDLNSLDFKYASNNFYGKAKQVLVFNTALSDADLETLTTL